MDFIHLRDAFAFLFVLWQSGYYMTPTLGYQHYVEAWAQSRLTK